MRTSVTALLAAAALLGASALEQAAKAATREQPRNAAQDAIEEPLTSEPGDAARGRAIVANRQVGLCLLCHTGPIPEERFQGTLAPELGGAGTRWSAGQLRLRLVDSRRLDPQTIMPPYFNTDGLVRVGATWQGKPVLSAQQIEDVVAYLRTLK